MLVLGAGEAMRRGEFIALFGSTAATLRLAARAQPHAKVPFIGFLGLAPEYSGVDALRAGFRDLSYIEDGNAVIMWRWAENVEQLPGSPPSWLLCLSMRPPARRPRRFPFAVHADPVGLGHVASLARPGGNVTGNVDAPHGARRQYWT